MYDMSDVIKMMGDFSRNTRADYHLTLGELIDALKTLPSDMPVVLDTGKSIGNPDSYRGYYSDLAFEPWLENTAGALLASAERALGSVFEGYKGGDFLMDEATPLWVAEYGDASGVAITGYTIAGGMLFLATLDTYRKMRNG